MAGGPSGFNGSQFLAISTSGTITTAFGTPRVSWTSNSLNGLTQPTSVAFGNGVWVITQGQGSSFVTCARSTNGTTNWSNPGMPVSSTWRGVIYGNNVFVAVGGSGNIATSPDGATWTAQTSGVTTQLTDVAYGAGVFVAIPDASNVAITSPDGITWTQCILPSSVSWSSITYSGMQFVAIASGSNISATSSDGITWSQEPLPTSSNWVSVASRVVA
jgi:hypothetical protein